MRPNAIKTCHPTPANATAPARLPKLPDQLRESLRARHYSHRTEQTSTQNQPLSPPSFLHRRVLGREVGELADVIRARKPPRKYPNVPGEWAWQPVVPQESLVGRVLPAASLCAHPSLVIQGVRTEVRRSRRFLLL